MAIEVEGEVNGVWTIDDSPISVLDTIFIAEDEVLTIEPGVVVNFQGPFPLLVQGVLAAEGTEEDSIFFQPIEDEFWCGIRADHGIFVTLDYCMVRDSRVGDEDIEISGGGLYCDETGLTVLHSTFSGNQCSLRGGAIYINRCQPCAISGSAFNGNSAGGGGALFISHVGRWAQISGNSFIENLASGSGAVAVSNASPVISYNTFIGNTAERVGALSIGHLCRAEVHHNVFAYNSATENNLAGAVYIMCGEMQFYSNTVVFNEGVSIMFLFEFDLEFTNCIILPIKI